MRTDIKREKDQLLKVIRRAGLELKGGYGYSPNELKIIAALLRSKQEMTTTKLAKKVLADPAEQIFGNNNIVSTTSYLRRKLERYKESVVLVKSKQRGPYPVCFKLEQAAA